MSAISKKLQNIVEQLPPRQLEEVINFAEFLESKVKKKSRNNLERLPRLRELNLPVIINVKYIGDPLLRREDLYNELGR